MDKKTLRAIVVEYRNKGWEFSKISKMLKEEYGIVRDRQALHGIYTRAIKSMNNEKSKYSVAAVADVVNVYTLGYSMAETRHIATSLGNFVSYYNVRDIIASEEEYIRSVKNTMACKAVGIIMEGRSQEEIKNEIAYKGVMPTEKGFNSVLVDAYTMIVLNAATNEIVKAYRDIENREIIKEVISNTGLNINIAEIKSRV